ncbi:polyprenyl synthetase family protein [Anaerobranca gottschalkii]|uniref:Farnesyl diphosphate synthase n=1 Tax=Anaerobranca gottschalkii DSM 13577 TaxID=1120990 RepID=A0A1H9Y1W9_9FIRM|nr:farnesyl diphosphate synthase [Anaerobranca gottschalkii]SES62801.1 geranylgeranyl diphosphate synthase, type II [Anaerobranca gottschalkii DSM 13577]
MELKEVLKDYKDFIDNHLCQFIPQDVPENLAKSMEYSLKAGGKRIRPLLLLLICDHYKISREISLPLALSIEYIHTYSLIHDDLPAMDNDDYRRGKLTNHKVFGEGMAILAGDALLTQAFNIISEVKGLSAEKKVKVISILSEASGPCGMIKGQVLDLENEGKILTEEELKEIHNNKTGKLLLAPLKMAAEVCDLKDCEKKALIKYGEALGLTFQITDDILDVCGNFQDMGKLTGSDEKLQKATYVSIMGLEKAQKLAQYYVQLGVNALKEGNLQIPYLKEILTYLLNRKG